MHSSSNGVLVDRCRGNQTPRSNKNNIRIFFRRQDKGLDHGCFSSPSILWSGNAGWPGAIVPLQVGVLQFLVPSARRCYKLGQAPRRAIESSPEDLKVALVATGGLSHQVHGERAGFNNTPWDHELLNLIENDPETLAGMTHADFARLGGFESAEVIMWLIMRDAMASGVRCLDKEYYLPSMTGIAVALYENEASALEALKVAARQAQLARIGHQLKGVEELEGTYPFMPETSVRAYRINKYLHQLIQPEFRERFLADADSTFEEAGLTAEECTMIVERDGEP
jgi:gallate dioxygenase